MPRHIKSDREQLVLDHTARRNRSTDSSINFSNLDSVDFEERINHHVGGRRLNDQYLISDDG